MNSPHLQLHAVSVSYGRTPAVKDVSLEVAQGALVTILGANGAGKSTLLNAIMGILPATGSICFDGRAIEQLPLEARVACGLSLVPERRELFPDLTVEDNLRLGGFRRRRAERDKSLDEAYAQFPRLKERRRQLAGTLSGGERQMLAMGRAVMAQPKLLMLDEPSLGLAPRIVEEVFQRLAALRESGVSILLVEQNARAALQIADYAYVLELGTISKHGPAAEIANDERLIESYLGLGGTEY
ncbi:MAG: ABC transporter ATP-binding protein [Burkholderiales bacterium]